MSIVLTDSDKTQLNFFLMCKKITPILFEDTDNLLTSIIFNRQNSTQAQRDAVPQSDIDLIKKVMKRIVRLKLYKIKHNL